VRTWASYFVYFDGLRSTKSQKWRPGEVDVLGDPHAHLTAAMEEETVLRYDSVPHHMQIDPVSSVSMWMLSVQPEICICQCDHS